MKKITDKERLDWLEAIGPINLHNYEGRWVYAYTDYEPTYQTLRKAIDAKIKAERKIKP